MLCWKKSIQWLYLSSGNVSQWSFPHAILWSIEKIYAFESIKKRAKNLLDGLIVRISFRLWRFRYLLNHRSLKWSFHRKINMLLFVLVLVKGMMMSLVRWVDFLKFDSSKSSPNTYKFASINFETERMENYHDGMFNRSAIICRNESFL